MKTLNHFQIYRALFFNFLKERNALVPYLVNLYMLNEGERNNTVTFSSKMTKRHPKVYVLSAFSWSRSFENSDYWIYMDSAWVLHFNFFNIRIKNKHPDTVRKICKLYGIDLSKHTPKTL